MWRAERRSKARPMLLDHPSMKSSSCSIRPQGVLWSHAHRLSTELGSFFA